MEEPSLAGVTPARRVGSLHAGAIAGAAASVAALLLAVTAVTSRSAAPYPGDRSVEAGSALRGNGCAGCDVARGRAQSRVPPSSVVLWTLGRHYPEPT